MNAWICCQIGAREHYAIPRALYQNDQLSMLLTDAWVPPESVLNRFSRIVPQSIRDRYHSDLPKAVIKGFNQELAAFEIIHKIRKTPIWPVTIKRNEWFQTKAIKYLESASHRLTASPENTVLFTYSYAALHLLRYAKKQGWKTILGQIDPGFVEEEIVARLQKEHPDLATIWQPAPQPYWETWKQECDLADQIVVNSQWSKKALQQSGLPETKISVVPLAYSSPKSAEYFQRDYPASFSAARPLRVLFLGQIILRKGIAALLQAAEHLQGLPIEFWMVGRSDIDPARFKQSNIRWIGAVSRSKTAHYYQQADLLILPTLSDGFALTQLEAQAWKLPVIASRFCGSVVQPNVNGFILDEVSEESITHRLKHCLNSPDLLKSLSGQSKVTSAFSLPEISQALAQCLSN
jgi:glycosyltransferase involved in cell wall biosynthesis